jgi:hypothetical protein
MMRGKCDFNVIGRITSCPLHGFLDWGFGWGDSDVSELLENFRLSQSLITESVLTCLTSNPPQALSILDILSGIRPLYYKMLYSRTIIYAAIRAPTIPPGDRCRARAIPRHCKVRAHWLNNTPAREKLLEFGQTFLHLVGCDNDIMHRLG